MKPIGVDPSHTKPGTAMLDSHRIQQDYATLNCVQMAAKYGTTADLMRRFVSDHGIRDPKASRAEMDRRLAVKFKARFGWSVDDIADQLMRPDRFVRRALASAYREPEQLALWPADAFRVPAPPMRIVHRHTPTKNAPCLQLELPLFTDQQLLAA